MLFQEIIAVCSENHTKPVNTNERYWLLKADGIYSYHSAVKVKRPVSNPFSTAAQSTDRVLVPTIWDTADPTATLGTVMNKKLRKKTSPSTVLALFNKLNSLQRYDIAQNYKTLHILVQRLSQHNLSTSHRRHI
jgi:hypothetical protein